MKTMLAAATLLLASASPLAAQSGGAMVSANDPAGIVSALEAAGYKAELSKDEAGDPMIHVDLAGWESRIYFYGCDEASHDKCDSIQFSAGFDRKQPWTADEAIQLSAKYRFVSVVLDSDNDPFIMWDVVTDDGIPTKVFLSSVLYFSDAIESTADIVFAEQNADKEAAE